LKTLKKGGYVFVFFIPNRRTDESEENIGKQDCICMLQKTIETARKMVLIIKM
jgi:hypothetical protein